ncbi:MAG: hypothetical protein HY800_10115 [Ignavibacteriales bacterium]|nr:hypothetical protein [Ignavibacteriales bacterium]
MKELKFLLILILVVIGTYFGYAQNLTRVEHRVQQLKEALQLSEEQTAKITEIMTRLEQQTAQEQSSKPINKKAMMKNRQKRITEADKEIEPLLTPEQLKKYESYKKERTNQMRSRSQGRKFKED